MSSLHGCVDMSQYSICLCNAFVSLLCLYTFDTVHSDCIGSFSA